MSEVDSVHVVLVGLELEGDRHRGREQRVRTRFKRSLVRTLT